MLAAWVSRTIRLSPFARERLPHHLPRLKGMNYCTYFLFTTRQNFGEDDKSVTPKGVEQGLPSPHPSDYPAALSQFEKIQVNVIRNSLESLLRRCYLS